MTRDIQEIIDELGFEYTGKTDASNLKVRGEVRNMCEANTCGFYKKSWMCPPACGDIEEFQKIFDRMTTCYVFQSFIELEDEFDFESMMELGDIHKKRLNKLAKIMADEYPDALVLGAGGCSICDECTYPDEPCRFPKIATTAMEAAGLVVSDVCKAANMDYNHGPGTMAYVSCVLV
ncbi:MAG: DUF2284 domain-containing protein [Coriobacteriales bacterium]|jgi:predicted metal-binding protein